MRGGPGWGGKRYALASALFVALELLLALWIRDGMTLNVVMLIHPLPGLRAWQGG